MGRTRYWGSYMFNGFFGWRRFLLLPLFGLLLAVGVIGGGDEARAEFGDVVINNYSDGAGMRPAVFPHWFHRIRFRCKVCHGDLGFEFKAGGNDITMLKIFDGQYCGACHNGQIAWSVENCTLCHSGKPDTRTQVHNSTLDRLVTPPEKAGQAKPTFDTKK